MTAARALPMFPSRLDVACDELVSRASTGPRYTSYPPATQFHAGFGADDAAGALAAIAPGDALSLYAHIPFCAQLCWYCGCNVTATRDRARGTAYVDTLTRALGLVASAIGGRPRVVELALGGGSPNFLHVADLERLLGTIRARFDVAPDAELGVELDPRDTRPDQVDAAAAMGFTRLSVGVQDFDPAVQQAIHRAQSIAQTRDVVARARHRGFRSVNVDLVYGLPGQTPGSISRTLDAVIGLTPDRLAVFGYAHLPHLRPHQRLVERAAPVPGLAARVELLRVVMDRLADAGYVRIGLDHFARPHDPLVDAARDGRLGRNFQGYVVKRATRLIGCGASAISDTGDAYWQDEVDVAGWTRAVDAGVLPVARGVRVDADDRLRRDVITRLMCDGRVELDATARAALVPELDRLARDHADLAHVDRVSGIVEATPLGHHLIRNVCAVFDRYHRPGAGGSATL